MVDNTKRFDGLADVYDLNRPDYPAAIMERLAAMVASIEGPRSCLDVGCGTGISTRALARALPGWAIVGLEPNADMLARDGSVRRPAGNPLPRGTGRDLADR